MRTTKTLRRLLGAAATMGIAAIIAAGCGSDDDGAASEPVASITKDSGAESEERITLRVGQLGAFTLVEALLDASGESDDLPYDIEYSLFPNGGPGFIEAAQAGSVDIASMADTPPIFGQVAKAPIKVVAAKKTVPDDASFVEILVPKDSPAKTLADLKGKQVAITEGTILQYTLVKALEREGLEYTAVEAVNLAPPDAATAFSSGNVDAAAALDPQRSILLAQGARRIADGIGVTAGLGYVVATTDALEDEAREAAIRDFVQRIRRAEEWADANGEEWAKVYAELTGLPLPVATAVVEREIAEYVPIDDAVYTAQQEQADAYTELGIIPTKLDVREQFDTRYNDLAGAVS